MKPKVQHTHLFNCADLDKVLRYLGVNYNSLWIRTPNIRSQCF